MTGTLVPTAAPSVGLGVTTRGRRGARVEAGLFATVVLLAVALRAPHLTLVPHFTDETWEVLWSLPIIRGEEFPLTNFNTFKGSLFNYLVAASFVVVGPGAFGARMVPLMTGILTVAATYGLGRAWGGPLAGLIAGALFAVSGAHILINSHIAWSNCLTPLFSTLGTWTLYTALARPNPRARGSADPPTHLLSEGRGAHSPFPPRAEARRFGSSPMLVISGLCWGLAFQTHPSIATMLPGAVLFALWRAPRVLRTPWPYLAVGALLLANLNLIVFNLTNGAQSISDAQKVQRNYTTDQEAASSYPVALVEEMVLLARLMGGAVDTREPAGAYLLDPVVLLGSALAVAGTVREARRGNPLPVLLSVSYLALLPAINPKFHTMLSSRYLMPLAPALFAATASLLAHRLSGEASRMWPVIRRDSTGRRGGLFGQDAARLAALAAALMLALGSLPPLVRYYNRAFANGETNQRALDLATLVTRVRQPMEPLVLDESFGSEIGWGSSEVRAMRYLLAFQDVEVRVFKMTPKRLEDELGGSPSLLTTLYGRQLHDYDRLPLEPVSPLPQRNSDLTVFRLSAKGQVKVRPAGLPGALDQSVGS